MRVFPSRHNIKSVRFEPESAEPAALPSKAAYFACEKPENAIGSLGGECSTRGGHLSARLRVRGRVPSGNSQSVNDSGGGPSDPDLKAGQHADQALTSSPTVVGKKASPRLCRPQKPVLLLNADLAAPSRHNPDIGIMQSFFGVAFPQLPCVVRRELPATLLQNHSAILETRLATPVWLVLTAWL